MESPVIVIVVGRHTTDYCMYMWCDQSDSRNSIYMASRKVFGEGGKGGRAEEKRVREAVQVGHLSFLIKKYKSGGDFTHVIAEHPS